MNEADVVPGEYIDESDCLCTHARCCHKCLGCKECKGFVRTRDKFYLCTCGCYADQHVCIHCDCEEYWNVYMNISGSNFRRRGIILKEHRRTTQPEADHAVGMGCKC